MPPLTDEQLSTLTPEEQSAIRDAEKEDGLDVDALRKIAASDTSSKDDDDDAPDAAKAGAAAPPIEGQGAGPGAAAAAAPAAAAPAPAASADAAPAPATVQARRYEAKLPDNYDATVKDLATREADLRAKFKEGDIEFDDFEEQRAAILTEREGLLVARTKAEVSDEFNAQGVTQEWNAKVAALMDRAATPEGGGVDYRKDTEKADDLDTFVKALAAKPENNDKPMEWFLNEGHRRVQALHGLTKPVLPPVVKDDKATIAAAVAARVPALDGAPKTLAHVPGSDGPGDIGGEFAELDQLNGLALEDKIRNMTPVQRERYLAS